MNLIVIHGNGLSSISEKVILIRKQFDPLSSFTIDGTGTEWDKIVSNISTGQLFSQKRLVVLEDFNPPSSACRLIQADLIKLSYDENLTIVFRFSRLLSQSEPILEEIKKLRGQIITFEEKDEVSIFPFLDLLADKNPKVFEKLEKHLKEWGGQYVLTMMFYMLRRMLMTTKKLPAFAAQRINKHKQSFSLERIKILYRLTLETDFKIKTGVMEEKLGLTLLVQNVIAP